jgi:hypothetical protein
MSRFTVDRSTSQAAPSPEAHLQPPWVIGAGLTRQPPRRRAETEALARCCRPWHEAMLKRGPGPSGRAIDRCERSVAAKPADEVRRRYLHGAYR